MQSKYRQLRERAYELGLAEWDALVALPTFRDFVSLYIAEGSKRNRNRVMVANSDPRVISLCAAWMRRLSCKPLSYTIQYHADQDLSALRTFWGGLLDIDGSVIKLLRKSNSGQLNGRSWRSQHGVLSLTVHDTMFRARLQAWIDRIREDWRLDSATRLGA
jgi:hypothetical protein